MAATKIGEFVTIERDGAIATVTMDRGDGRNALSRQLIQEMTAAARGFGDDLETQAVILTGKGAFSAGADLKDPAMDRRRASGLLERRHMTRIGPDLCDAWEKVEQVTICAIEKYCIGGGGALAAACDFRIMAGGAHMRLPEIPLGMNMSWHAVPRLVALIGPSRTKQFVIFGESSRRRGRSPGASPTRSCRTARRSPRRGAGRTRSPSCRRMRCACRSRG
ncbi:MAG: enoyl-CoA hydratase/isomerase family protein [Rhizomicrobium sp.]